MVADQLDDYQGPAGRVQRLSAPLPTFTVLIVRLRHAVDLPGTWFVDSLALADHDCQFCLGRQSRPVPGCRRCAHWPEPLDAWLAAVSAPCAWYARLRCHAGGFF